MRIFNASNVRFYYNVPSVPSQRADVPEVGQCSLNDLHDMFNVGYIASLSRKAGRVTEDMIPEHSRFRDPESL